MPCPDSPVRTPINPVKKVPQDGQPMAWRFVQDLKAVNDVVHGRALVVPDPHTILIRVPRNSKYFIVVDLATAFFSIPVNPDSQFRYAYTFKGKAYVHMYESRIC